eukprot:m.45720 g.45720  ORF g.45720 m.45720 type:complete len:394 (+) comp6260_c0_seq1:25-1206(+)
MAAKMARSLFTTDYPIYAIEVTPENRIVVAGGGGTAKTGVPNAIEMYAVLPDGSARALCRHDEDNGAVMNLALHPRAEIAAAGVAGQMRLFSLPNQQTLHEMPQLAPAGQQKTDFSEEGFQNVVRFSNDGSRVATAGDDGNMRVWTYPSLRQQHAIAVGSKPSDQVSDLDFDPTGARLVSVSSGPSASIWTTFDGRKERELNWFHSSALDSPSYNFRCCRFVSVGGTSRLFTAVTPSRSPNSSKLFSYVVAWDPSNWTELARAPSGQNDISALAASNDGRFVATGDIGGFVTVFSSSNLAQLIHVQAHGLFVTDLAFFISPDNISVLSVSADKFCVQTDVVVRTSSKDLIMLFIGLLVCLLLFFIFRHSILPAEFMEPSSDYLPPPNAHDGSL